MGRPRKIIDLDESAFAESEAADREAVYLLDRQLWTLEPVVCAMCGDSAGLSGAGTFLPTDAAGSSQYRCLTHGDLRRVPCTIRKSYHANVGGQEIAHETTENDFFLFPASMTEEESKYLISKFLKQIKEEEFLQQNLENEDA